MATATREPVIGGLGPDRWRRRRFGEREIFADRGLPGARAATRVALDLPLGEWRTRSFHEVQPRRAGPCEVQVESLARGGPASYAWGLVSAVVVEHEVDINDRRSGSMPPIVMGWGRRPGKPTRILQLGDWDRALESGSFHRHRAPGRARSATLRTDAGASPHAPTAPVRRVARRALQVPHDEILDRRIADPPWGPGAVAHQAGDACGDKSHVANFETVAPVVRSLRAIDLFEAATAARA